jgi:hypothetical protein
VDHGEAITAAERADDVPALISALEALAAALADQGDYERAACILGGIEALRSAPPAEPVRTWAVVEEALGTVRLAQIIADGRRLERPDLIRLALDAS